MKIAAIRSAIRCAAWSRSDLTGGTRDEFVRQDVGGRLAAAIAELRALVIAPRFAKDAQDRDAEIARCEAVIARWQAAQPVQVLRAGYDRVALVFADSSRKDVPAYVAQVFADRLGAVITAHVEAPRLANVIDFAAERARRMAA